jgi:hypothetical protein
MTPVDLARGGRLDAVIADCGGGVEAVGDVFIRELLEEGFSTASANKRRRPDQRARSAAVRCSSSLTRMRRIV